MSCDLRGCCEDAKTIGSDDKTWLPELSSDWHEDPTWLWIKICLLLSISIFLSFVFFFLYIILNEPKQQLLVTSCCLGLKAHKTTTFCHCVGSCSNRNSHTAWAPIQPATSLHRNFLSSPSAPHAFFFVLFLVLKGQNIL